MLLRGKRAHACINSACCKSAFSVVRLLGRVTFCDERLSLPHDILRSCEPHERFPQIPSQPVACARALLRRLPQQRCQLASRTLPLRGPRDNARKATWTSRRTNFRGPRPRSGRRCWRRPQRSPGRCIPGGVPSTDVTSNHGCGQSPSTGRQVFDLVHPRACGAP